jgi:2-polyprenyl-3-methyl-5-hydroxy-6-metoxy-1,4-benzoquinol methylase
MSKFGEEYFERGVGSNYTSYRKKMMAVFKSGYLPRVVRDIHIFKGMKVLDIGCAYGLFLKLIEELGAETYGVDISGYAIERAKKETRATLYLHDVEKGLPMFPDNMFDLVTMFDVIEHLSSPFYVLREVLRVLKPRGKMIVTSPNLNAVERYVRKLLRREAEWHGYRDVTHLYLFTPASLRFLVERSGFKIVRVETPFHPLPKILQKIADKTALGGQIWLVAEKPE